MSDIYFSSDFHLHHDNIRKYCKRPFKSVEEMDETIIGNWNAVVKPGDTAYFLGDFAFVREVADVERLLRRFNGHLHLIVGNHDRKQVIKAKGFASVDNLRRVIIDSVDVVMCHYAMLVWEKSHHGSLHLHGHSHGTLPDDPRARRCDVGVDAWNFMPVSWWQIKEAMKRKIWQPIDSHGASDRSPDVNPVAMEIEETEA